MREQNQPTAKVIPIEGQTPVRFRTGDEALPGRLPELKRDLAAWAVKYPKFRAELIRSPRAVVEKELGSGLPEDCEVRVLEEDEKTLYFVIPLNPMAGMAPADELRAGTGIRPLDLASWAGEAASLDARLIARTWQDEPFRRALLSDPGRTLREEGVALPAGVEVKVVEDTVTCWYLTLPAVNDNFTGGEISEQDLETLAPAMVAGTPPLSVLCTV